MERELMNTITLPTLYCPFEPALHPFADAIGEQSIEWALELRMITEKHVVQVVRDVQFDLLVGQAYPNASLNDLRFISDWSMWLLLWDDVCGGPGICDQPRKQAAIHRRLLDILNGASVTDLDHPLVYGLHDIRQRMEDRLSSISMQRFIRAVAESFYASVWEAHNRAHKRIPDVAIYLQKRVLTSALFTYLEIFEITHGFVLSLEMRCHAAIQELGRKANNIICWCNDIISYQKEMHQGDVHNLVLLLQHAHDIDLQEAIDRVATLHDAEVHAYLQLESSLPALGLSMSTDIKQYLALLRSWMSANMYWSLLSGRYQSSARGKEVGRSTSS
jgi:5-epi-alpha-selinene synthase